MAEALEEKKSWEKFPEIALLGKVLFQLYQKEGLAERAERVFDQVRTLDPDFPIPEAPEDKEPKKKKSLGNKKAG